MTPDHLDQDTLAAFANGALSEAPLEAADRHLGSCERCRATLAGLVAGAPGMLAAVQLERRRHLSYDELEAFLDGTSGDDTDALAQAHMARCDSCQRELADLRAFEVRLATTAPQAKAAVAAGAAAAPGRRQRAWMPFTWAAAAVAVLVLVVAPRVRELVTDPVAGPAAIAVRLDPPGSRPADRTSALTPEGAGRLGPSITQPLGQARRRAAETGMPQTLALTMTNREYDVLIDELRRIGTLDGPEPAASGAPDGRIDVSIMLLPPAMPAGGNSQPGNR